MPIRPLLEAEQAVFSPDDLQVIASAFDDVLRTMGLVDRNDPVVTMLAKHTIELAKRGERDPARLRDMVIKLATDASK